MQGMENNVKLSTITLRRRMMIQQEIKKFICLFPYPNPKRDYIKRYLSFAFSSTQVRFDLNNDFDFFLLF